MKPRSPTPRTGCRGGRRACRRHGIHNPQIHRRRCGSRQAEDPPCRPVRRPHIRLSRFLRGEAPPASGSIRRGTIFRVFELTPFDSVKVVIPSGLHHAPDRRGLSQAHGASRRPRYRISTRKCRPIPACASRARQSGKLGTTGRSSAERCLTVEDGRAGSHQCAGNLYRRRHRGAEPREQNLYFYILGPGGEDKGAVIDRERHLVLTSAAPSPPSASSGFPAANLRLPTLSGVARHCPSTPQPA